jgi:hypothetical protein
VVVVTTAHLKLDQAERLADHLDVFRRTDPSIPEDLRSTIRNAGGLQFNRDRDVVAFIAPAEGIAPAEYWGVLQKALDTFRWQDKKGRRLPFWSKLARPDHAYYVRGDGENLRVGAANEWEQRFAEALVAARSAASTVPGRDEPADILRRYRDQTGASYGDIDTEHAPALRGELRGDGGRTPTLVGASLAAALGTPSLFSAQPLRSAVGAATGAALGADEKGGWGAGALLGAAVLSDSATVVL